MSILSGFVKKAYNNYGGMTSSIGQPNYQQANQSAPASSGPGAGTYAVGGIAAAGALAHGAHKARVGKHMSNFKSQVQTAKKGPDWLDRAIGGGALQQAKNKQLNAMKGARSSYNQAQQLRASGTLGIKGAINKGIGVAKGFLKRAMKEVSVVAVTHKDKLLMGKRRDNGKWTQPGGHLEKGEDPTAGAARELYEEAAIKAKNLKHLGSKTTTNPEGVKLKIHAFQMNCSEKPSSSSKNDPDKEVARWIWVPKKLPASVASKLHVQKNNILLDLLRVKY